MLAFGEDVEPVHHLDRADVIVVARRRLPRRAARRGSATPATSPPAASRRRTARREAEGDEPALRRRADADHHRRAGRPPAPRRGRARSRACARAIAQGVGRRGRRGRRRSRLAERPGRVREGASSPTSRPTRARAWSSPATPSRPRSTPWPTRSTHALGNVGKTVELHRPGRGRARRPARLAPRAGRGHERRQGRRRCSSSAATRPTTPRPTSTSPRPLDEERQDDDPPRPLRGRDLRALPLAHPRGPLPRVLGRRPRLRRHGDDRPAADRPALRRQVGPRAPRRPAGASRLAAGAGHRPRRTGRARSRGGDFDAFWRKTLHDGVVAGTAAKPKAVTLKPLGALPASAEPADRRRSRSSSAPTRRSGTAGSPTTAGSRSCPSR